MLLRYGSVLLALMAISVPPALAQQATGQQPAGQEAGPCGERVTIESGDTLGAIATRCGTTVAAIEAANPDLGDPRRLAIGTEVLMPRGTAEAGTAPSPSASPSPSPSTSDTSETPAQRPSGDESTHVIQEGDTWDSIAQQSGVSVEALMAANPQLASVALNVGERVEIPPPAAGKGPAPELPRAGEGGEDGPLRIVGELTGEGVECPALRSLDGTLYTLSGEIDRYSEGDRVVVTGAKAGASVCMQGTTIVVETIAPAS